MPLTAGRSLAVDPQYLPLGAPLWLDTTAPYAEGDRPLRRLVVRRTPAAPCAGPYAATCSGARELAEHLAGYMKSQGRLYILLPRGLTPTS